MRACYIDFQLNGQLDVRMNTIGVKEFKAKCWEILGRLGMHETETLTITKYGKPVFILTAARGGEVAVHKVHSSLHKQRDQPLQVP